MSESKISVGEAFKRLGYWFVTRVSIALSMTIMGLTVLWRFSKEESPWLPMGIFCLFCCIIIGTGVWVQRELLWKPQRFKETLHNLHLLTEWEELWATRASLLRRCDALVRMHALAWGENSFSQDEKESISEVYRIAANRYWAAVAKHNERRLCFLHTLNLQRIPHAEKFVAKEIEWGPPSPYPTAFSIHV